MERSVYNITLDIQRNHAATELTVKRFDTHRRLRIRLLSGGSPYPMTDDCYAVFTAQKPDGTVLYNPCIREGSTLVYDLTPQTTAAAGVLDCELRLYGADDALLTSAAFTIAVEDTVYTEGDEAITSTGEVSALTQLITQARDTISEMEKVLANEPGHAIIDDTKAGTDAWSSKNIVDRLCPAFEETGSVVTCAPVEGYPLGVVTRIDPVQEGEGDPYPPGGGKNLLEITDSDLFSGYWLDGSGGMSDTNARFIGIAGKPVKPNTTYTLSSNLTIYSVWMANTSGVLERLGVNGKAAVTFTTPADCSRIRITLNNTSGAADTTAFEWAQLELGDTATEYAPYSNIRPVSGHKSTVLYRGGKNLSPNISRSNINSGLTVNFKNNILTINGSGSCSIGGYNANYAFLLPAGTFTWSLKRVSGTCSTTGATGTVYMRIATGGYVSVSDMYGITQRISTFTLTEPTSVCFDVTANGTFENLAFTFQIEKGDTATDYEPYRGNTFTMELGQTVYGGSLDWASGVLTVDRGIYDLGDFQWEWFYDGADAAIIRTKDLIGIGHDWIEAWNPDTACLCSHYENYSAFGITEICNGHVFGYLSQDVDSDEYYCEAGLYIENDDFIEQPIEDFVESLKGAQFSVPLKNPITVQLTPTEIMALAGTNYLYADAGDTTVAGRKDLIPILNNL